MAIEIRKDSDPERYSVWTFQSGTYERGRCIGNSYESKLPALRQARQELFSDLGEIQEMIEDELAKGIDKTQ